MTTWKAKLAYVWGRSPPQRWFADPLDKIVDGPRIPYSRTDAVRRKRKRAMQASRAK